MPELISAIIVDNPSIKLIITAVVKFTSVIDMKKIIEVELIQQPKIILAEDDLDVIAK
ncbi:hypothetical protein ACJMK2_023212, partial [Sinanodonta woodiana]